jgi:hypothetical protein
VAEAPPEPDFPPVPLGLLLLLELHPRASSANESPQAPIANGLRRWDPKFFMIRSCSLVVLGWNGRWLPTLTRK